METLGARLHILFPNEDSIWLTRNQFTWKSQIIKRSHIYNSGISHMQTKLPNMKQIDTVKQDWVMMHVAC